MKPLTRLLKVSALLLCLFCSLAMTCNQEMMKFGRDAKITLTPEQVVNINGRLEFSIDMEYNTHLVEKADSLEFRFYLMNSQIETLLGSVTDTDLKSPPQLREVKKNFKTTWFSKVPITNIEMQTVLYKNGKYKTMPNLIVGEIVSKPAKQP